MIRIVKPVKPPKILTTKGTEQTRKDCAAYDDSPSDYRSGEKKFYIDSQIYGNKSVKNALLLAQHSKCCYCERKLNSYGAVEHYRPKGAVKQAPQQKQEYPGYYWLAYDWNNLLVSCERCNTSHKGNLFPLIDNNARAGSHRDDITIEQPLLINPAVVEPWDHIRFREDAPEPLTEIGRITIQYLSLRRAQLEEARRERLAALKICWNFIEVTKNSNDADIQQMRDEAIKFLAASMYPEAEYSAMAQDFIKSSTSFSQEILPSGQWLDGTATRNNLRPHTI